MKTIKLLIDFGSAIVIGVFCAIALVSGMVAIETFGKYLGLR